MTLRTRRYCFLSHSVLGEGVSYAYDLGKISKCLGWGKILLSALAGGKCLSWWEVPGSGGLFEEEAGCSLQVQARAPLRPAPAGNANQDRMAQETMSLGTLGH